MEEVSRRDGYDDAVTGGREGGEGSVAGDDVELSTSSNVDDANGNAATDYRRLINEQRHELEELKRAAREASPSSRLVRHKEISAAGVAVSLVLV